MSYPSAPRRTHQIDVVDQVGRAYRAVFDRLQLVVEMALLPFLIVQMLISGLSRMFPSLLGIVFEALRLVVAFIGAAVIAALLSHLYRDIGAANETV